MKLAIASLLMLGFATPATAQITPPQCGDFVSYGMTADGSCFDLSGFSEMGSLNREITSLNREINPITANGLNLRADGRYIYLVGSLSNRSARSQWVNRATFALTRRIEGRVERYGTVEVAIARQLAPGGVTQIEWPVDIQPQTGTAIALDSVEVW